MRLFRQTLALLLLVFQACAHVPPPVAAQPSYFWSPGSLDVVIDPQAPPCALQSAQMALEFLEVSLPVQVRLGVATGLEDGQVVVFWQDPQTVDNDQDGAPDAEGALGLSVISHYGPAMIRSKTYLLTCDARVWAHELGHSFGLLDLQAPGNLMHWSYPDGGWRLTQAQRDLITAAGK